MLERYLVLCLGCALLQVAAARMPKPLDAGGDILSVPVGAVTNPQTYAKLFAAVVTLGWLSLAAEVVAGALVVSLWAGLLLWLPALIAVSIFLQHLHPFFLFCSGLVIAAVGAALMLTA